MSRLQVEPPAPFWREGDHFTIELPGARAVFTTRRGGRSAGPYASLNLGVFTDDDPRAVAANLSEVERAFGVRPVWGRQVHGATVSVADAEAAGRQADEADGRVATAAGVAPMVLTADCLAVAVAGGGAVAMLHAGWRGLAGGVIEEGVRLVRELGRDEGAAPAAAIGPHARACCYEVGEEVHSVFAAPGHGFPTGARTGRNLDMTAVAVAQLHAAGVSLVHDLGMCTICSDPALFFSHRRDHGVTGRQAGLAWLT